MGTLAAGRNNAKMNGLGTIKMPIFTDIDVQFDDVVEAKKISNWGPLMQTLKIWGTRRETFENTTDDLNVVTTPSGSKIAGSPTNKSYIVYLKCNDFDWLNIKQQFEGCSEYRCIDLYDCGSMKGTRNGKYWRGQACTVTCSDKGAEVDNADRYALHVHFSDSENEDMLNGYTIKPEFNFITEYIAAIPDSRSLTTITDLDGAGSEITVQLTDASINGAAITDALTADFEVISSDPSGATVTAAAEGTIDGQYVLTLTTALGAWENVKIRYNKAYAGGSFTAISNYITITGS